MRPRAVNNDGFMGRINDHAQTPRLPPRISIAGSNLCLIGYRIAPPICPPPAR